eukprot:8087976-Alexandrium_andersonii.AAC.1
MLWEAEMFVGNTKFQKSEHSAVTFRDVRQDERAQIDFVVVENCRRGCLRDVYSDTRHYFPSDHYPVIANLRFTFRPDVRGRPEQGWKGVEKPTGEERVQYNER